MILGIMFAVAFTGCSDETGLTDVEMSGTDVLFAEDPLDGVLNSTMDNTPPDPTERIDKLAEVLGLDEDQKTALLAAYTEFRDGVAALRELVKSGELTCEEAREQVTALREAFEAELQVILTPEQYDLLQEMRQKQARPEDRSPYGERPLGRLAGRDRSRRGPDGRGSGGPGDIPRRDTRPS